MKAGTFISFFSFVLVSAISVISGPGCANVIPPEGGPRDTIPPVLLNVSPDDSTRNFSGKTIVFTFDEFVDAPNVRQDLLISPLLAQFPDVNAKLKIVTVKFKDSLEANTTYTFDFGDAVKDFTEGNPVRDLSYTFSTGRYIDSLELRGNVILAETGKIDTTLIVMLHTNPSDSAVDKEKPRYIAKLDGKGNFVFKNLPPKTFYLYTLKPQGGSYFYSDKELFGFADKPVDLQSNTPPVTLYAYQAYKPIAGTVNLPSLTIGGGNKRPTEADNRLRYQTGLTNGQQDLLTGFYMTFDRPLKIFDSSKIRLYTDSVYNPVPSYSFTKDSSNRKILVAVEWKENTSYHIIMDKDFAQDSSGKKLLKTDTLSFKTKRLAEYGSLKIKFRNLQLDKNPVLLFMQGETIYRSFPLAGPDFAQQLFLPGEFELRILFDENKNGKWDPGEFFGKHKQPEIVKPVERRIIVKAAWQ